MLFALITISCENNDTSNSTSVNITGKWILASYRISNFENTGTTVDDWESTIPRPTFEFKNNNSVVDNLINGKLREMTYEIKGNSILFQKSIAYETHNSFTYKITGSRLELKREDRHTLQNGNLFVESTEVILIKQ